ncbi:exodeoxyribonuclease V subunit beta [Castellaniella caeni]|uniref:exodeoxyribonuclease V subunit beta n=1 Tax=Castellaniella caeni TaxID=266123 RepID=UPI0008300D1B|nr:exodeoxyribonuclease V subunit beta [Castellaniella caeni]
MSDFTLLDALRLPLRGSCLIEASAGTGKTYTLAALYVRLVLGHGRIATFGGRGQALSPRDILVLTFTRAATQELRERIRERLAQAADVFQQASQQQLDAGPQAVQALIDTVQDGFLRALLADSAAQADLALCARRCRQAAQEMDLAAIYTIHSFCQRALKRFAFAAGMAFEQELQAEAAALRDTVLKDYWRCFIQPLPTAVCRQLAHAQISSPAGLAKALRAMADEGAADVTDTDASGVAVPFPARLTQIDPALQAAEAALDEARALLAEQQGRLTDWLAAQVELGNLGSRQLSKKSAEALAVFLDEGKCKEGLRAYTPDGLKWLKGRAQAIPEALAGCLAALARCLDKQEAVPELPLDELLRHAAGWIAAEEARRLRDRAQITYDTMVVSLAHALRREARQGRPVLAQQLFDAYPAALIDEFQDTDPHQYAIFQHIYGQRDPDAHAWLMIGDPKQAIYGFRGADIQTYAAASQAAAARYTLQTNYRSARDMVRACNHLFLQSPLALADGGVFGTDSIQYRPIEARGRDWQLLADGQPMAALTISYPADGAVYTKTQAEAALAGQFAARVAALLDEARAGRALLRHADGRQAALEPRQIACLVRTGAQADQLKAALKRVGVDAVFLSEKSSVYDSPTAIDLFRLLDAIAHPQEAGRVRAALASDLMAYAPEALVAEVTQEDRWQQHLLAFRQLQETWQRLGVLPMLHRCVQRLDLPRRQRDERVLTDLFHLAELLQQASVGLDGMQALLAYLEAAIASQRPGGEDHAELLLRLENEQDRVIIMTLHGAKGLEFPLVMLPFTCLAQGPDWEAEAAEEMRLLYVGVTRAVHACWLGVLPCAHGRSAAHQLETSPLGRLLLGAQHVELDAVQARLEQLCQGAEDAIRLEMTAPQAPAPRAAEMDLPPLAPPGTRMPRVPPTWIVTSYSRLISQAERGGFTPASERLLERGDAGDQGPLPDADGSIHRFPRGPEAGNLLHGLLEKACALGFARASTVPEAERLARRMCRAEPWSAYQDTLAAWLPRLLTTPLPLGGTTCALAQAQGSRAETEFWLRLRQTALQPLEACAARLLPGARQELPAQRLNGMLKGFIDLLFRVGERYYVLDYKSNHLGEHAAAYDLPAMRRAMLDHRYDLQGLLYQVALHRLLRERLPGYDPARHLGGSLFFFLRGIDSESRGIVPLLADLDVLTAVDALFDGAST